MFFTFVELLASEAVRFYSILIYFIIISIITYFIIYIFFFD